VRGDPADITVREIPELELKDLPLPVVELSPLTASAMLWSFCL
jgi:hypothetical protein